MPIHLAIFDLDGTLVDSFDWFLRAMNSMAGQFGFRPVPEGEVEALRHAGPREIMRRLEVPVWKLPLLQRHMRTLKAAEEGEITLFPGASRMLRALADAGVLLALVSSDAEANARRHLGAENSALFSDFACGASLLGKAAKFRRVLRRTQVEAVQAVAIGDEIRDIEAARAAGVACAAVTWGYAAPSALRSLTPDFVFDRMEHIPSALIART